MSEPNSEIGLIGLAVMGQNLALNIADHGFKISVFNRTTSKMQDFVKNHPDTPGGLVGFETLNAFVLSLKKPRKIIILVQAGWATDKVIESLVDIHVWQNMTFRKVSGQSEDTFLGQKIEPDAAVTTRESSSGQNSPTQPCKNPISEG